MAAASAKRRPLAAIRLGLVCAVIGTSPAVLADTGGSSPQELGWQTLDRAALQRVPGPLYFDDRWLVYQLEVKGRQLAMTAQTSRQRMALMLSIQDKGQIDDSEGRRAEIQARQDDLRICVLDEPQACWPLRRTKQRPPALTSEEIEQRIRTNAELAVKACGAGKVQAVRVTGFSCQP
jgi:hypothetical protein